MFAIAEMCGEVFEGVHAEITFLRAIAVAVETILHEQGLDFFFEYLIGHGWGAKEEEWEKTRENHDLRIRLFWSGAFK